MGDPLRNVRSGDPLLIPAEAWNTLMGVARERAAARQNQGGEEYLARPTGGLVLVKNGSGADRERFNILGIDGPIFTPTESEQTFVNRVALSCLTPATADHLGRFVILAEPLKNGKLGRAWVFGACPVKVNVSDEAHRYADVKDGDATQLQSAAQGSAAILWAEAGTGSKWAVVRLGSALGTASVPAVILPESFETETAQTDTWDRDDPPSGKDGVTIRLQTRTAYNDAGDQKLYAYHRELTFDDRGVLKAISAETRVTVDTPEACTS